MEKKVVLVTDNSRWDNEPFEKKESVIAGCYLRQLSPKGSPSLILVWGDPIAVDDWVEFHRYLGGPGFKVKVLPTSEE